MAWSQLYRPKGPGGAFPPNARCEHHHYDYEPECLVNLGALLFFTLVNALNYLDRYLVAAVLPTVIHDLNLTRTEGGWLVSAFVPGYIIFSPIFGYLGDRFPRPKLMAFGIFLWSLATVLSGVSHSYWMLLIARTCVGVGEASFVAMAPGYFKDRISDPTKLNSALSLFFSAVPVGSALGYALGTYIEGHSSWHTAFFICGAPGLLCSFFILRFKEVRRIAASPPPILESLRTLFRIQDLWFIVGGYVLNSFALSGVASFVTDYGVELGFTLESIGKAFGIILLCAGFAGSLGGGRLGSLFAKRCKDINVGLSYYIGISAALSAPLLYLAFATNNTTAFLVLCCFTELLVFAGTGPVNSLIVLSSPQALLTLTQGLSILLINLFGALPSSVIVGRIADASTLRFGLQFLTVPLLGSGLLWLIGARKRKERLEAAQ